MRLTTHTDFSLRVLMYCGLKGDELATIQEISERYGISRNHLMKVTQQLARTGYVDSVRGQKGGIRLNRDKRLIRLGDVVRDMEPDLALVECMRPDNACIITPACRLTRIFHDARDVFINELNKHTLADLLSRGTRGDLVKLLDLESG